MERECRHHNWSRREFEDQNGYRDYKQCNTCGMYWDSYAPHPKPRVFEVFEFDVPQAEVDAAIASINKTIEERA